MHLTTYKFIKNAWLSQGPTARRGGEVAGSGVVVVERLERSLQFLFSRVERRSSSCFSCFSSILPTSCRNWHLTSIITGKPSSHMQFCIKSCISYVNCNALYVTEIFSS